MAEMTVVEKAEMKDDASVAMMVDSKVESKAAMKVVWTALTRVDGWAVKRGDSSVVSTAAWLVAVRAAT